MSDRAVAGGELRPSGLHRGEALAQPTEFASPLAEIEARVQRRAKSMALDLDVGGSEQALRDLIADELAAWSVECRRGLRSQDISDPSQVAQRAFVNLAKYGPLSVLLEDPDVWEIMVNAPDAIFVKRHSGQSGFHHEVFHDDDHVIRTLTRLLDDATGSHRTLEPLLGLQDAQLPDGSRLHIVHRDLARGGHLMVNIRKFTGVAFSSLDELVEHGMLGVEAARFLRAVVSARLSMVVSGAPGSGKTTLLNCAAGHLDPSLRVVVAEEVFETDVPLANVASMQTRGGRGEREEVTLRQLVAGFLRMAPDVAIVGEVRDDEALPLLRTLSSGVKGYTTIHAGSARQALTRLRFVSQLADAGRNLPLSALNTLVSEAVDVVVHTERTADGPRVIEILAVEDLAGGPDAAQFTVTPVFERARLDGPLAWSGLVPVRVKTALDRSGIALDDVLPMQRAANRRGEVAEVSP
ncbi:MAG: ATPase, T2SS/T4P/T4SS family [Candidatus Microthrix subdominans]|jgi:pilus assembly protein CpaF|nr:ATPase, T2SS/T4P/T4SS family [Candidatus Microthrix sp.]MBK6312087.1 CpaF family protein [Candidatus Microthrix sp.]MBK9558687.1 CpaF family protein [Candidatus Microthrix sp.]MBP7595381.1 CpaF family protein [Candidatus Microthrix sp.]MBP9067264.1 CpaF family protein [Candidatus Microthrix sp.]